MSDEMQEPEATGDVPTQDEEMKSIPEGETAPMEENPEDSTPKSASRPRPTFYPHRRNMPFYRRGYPSHPGPFRMGYSHMYPRRRMWSPRPGLRPYMIPPHGPPPPARIPSNEPLPSPTDPQEHNPPPHWMKHLDNAILRPCFDWVKANEAFTRVNPEIDDSALNEALTLRGEELLPSQTEIKVVVELVDMLLTASKRIAASEEASDKELNVEEAILVGSFKKQTYSKGATTADIVIVLKELPTEAKLDKLGERLVKETRIVAKEELDKCKKELETKIEGFKSADKEDKEDSKEQVKELASCELKLKNYPSESEYTCTTNKLTSSSFLVISSTGASAKIFATADSSMIKQEDSTQDNIDLTVFETSLRMARHAKWFESNCNSETIPCLVRVLKDMKKRFPGWKSFNPWLMDLIAYKAVLDKCEESRDIGVAFRYVLQIISAGCFLLGFNGIEDPCEKHFPASQYSLSDEAKDEITLAGQILLRMLQNGAYREIIGGQGIQVLDLSRPFSVGGIQFAPPQRAFESVPVPEENTATIESVA